MWKVGCFKIDTAAGRRIVSPGRHRNWWKSAFLYKTVHTWKFSMWQFSGGWTHGIVRRPRFRICVIKGSYFCPCYSCPKSGEGRKTRFARKIKRYHKKFYGFPKNCKTCLWHRTPVLFLFLNRESTSAGRNSALNTPHPPLPYIFWKHWTCSFTWYHPIYDIPIQKIDGDVIPRP